MEAMCRVIPRTAKSEVRIQRTLYKSKDYINVCLYRNMINKETGEREWFPTKKGIAIPLEHLTDYIAVLQEVAAEADPPEDVPQEDAAALARAQMEAASRPLERLCLGCIRDCKQYAGVLVDCPRYQAADHSPKKGGRKK